MNILILYGAAQQGANVLYPRCTNAAPILFVSCSNGAPFNQFHSYPNICLIESFHTYSHKYFVPN